MMATLLILMIVPEGLDYRALVQESSPAAGGMVSRLLWAGLLGLGLVVILLRINLALQLLRRLNVFLPLMLLLALASIAWSIEPALSLRRVIRMLTMVVVCTAFVLVAWHPQRMQRLLRRVITAVLLGSLAFGLLYPELAIHQGSAAELVGAWRGLTNHKNGLGGLASIGVILWLHAALTRQGTALPIATGLVASVSCLLLSRSSTALIVTCVVATVLAVMLRGPQRIRPYLPQLFVLLVGTIMVYALAMLQIVPGLGTLMAPVVALTDKDTSFTGRSNIWALITEHSAQHPMLGTGYGAYWTPVPMPGGDSFEFVRRMGGFYPGSAHNGYLEILNDLGWVGLVLLLGFIAVFLLQALRQLRIDPPQAALYLAILLHQAITNLSETHWFGVLSVDFVIVCLCTTSLARAALQGSLRATHGVESFATGSGQPQPGAAR